MLYVPIATGDGDAPSPIRLSVLSLCAGVQSTTLVLLAAHGIVAAQPITVFMTGSDAGDPFGI
ncbi:hypothetical protein GA830_19440 (plasmid) [Mesorhizobium sp. NBSH29]|uniref:hypothetical protein n=1 Tax=Mesorhizobium sp. NBSH29 TaxID=2654249 RepID=UPI001896A4CD|nr:hypothetical protein [Mesorhizobium sp. NBSH29]QPC89010.1 hypothetical protein GA830_19440 [Mesorhizobium sp. NBSH29]